MKKLSEGPVIRYANADELLLGVERRLDEIAPAPGDDLTTQARRKLNRLAGDLEGKLARLASTRREFADMLQPVAALAALPAAARDDVKLLILCVERLEVLAKMTSADPRGMWLAYDAMSTFGPLGHAAIHAAGGPGKVPKLDELHARNLRLLRDIRQHLATREGPSVVAHRGSGPTNRTMGGLITQTDQRRTNRPAENSPDAFNAALEEVTRPEGSDRPTPRLDGIECDVFLSLDGVPMLSHEGRVSEQLSTVQAVASQLAEETEVRHLTAEQLSKIRRTESPGSGFISLAELLRIVRPYAEVYFEATGFPLRVEIEMKGTKHDADFPRDGDESPLTKAVAKVVSREIKLARGRPVEYILFNGTPTDVPRFSALRTQKTALGGLYTGHAPGKPDTAGLDPAEIDELRFQFTSVLPPRDRLGKGLDDKRPRELVDKLLKDFVVTLVYGQEFAPRDHPAYDTPALKGSEPSEDIVMSRGVNDAVTKALKRRQRLEADTEDLVQRWLEEFVAESARAGRLHVLTDFPPKAWWMKQLLSKAAHGSQHRV